MVRPSEREVEILRRIVRCGALLVTYTDGRPHFTYADGAVIRVTKGRPFDRHDFLKFTKCGWLIPDPHAPGLFGDGPSQRYVARVVRAR